MIRPLAGSLALLLLPFAATAGARLPDGFVLERIVGGPFDDGPVAFARLPDGRALLVERTGVVRVAAAGATRSDSVFTVPGVTSAHPERGLLGIAVDPGWPSRPYVYLDYTHADSVTKITRYRVAGNLTDPSATDLMLSEPFHVLDDIPDLQGIHNAGTLRFGPRGLLHISCGDDSRGCETQDLDSPLGKILRVDVRGLPDGPGGPPSRADLAPPSNPLGALTGGTGWRALIYAWGLRNPYRFTVGPSGRVMIGSVGWNDYEEINVIPGPSRRNNYGWPLLEGDVPVKFFGECGRGRPFRDAVHLIPHPFGPVSVIGGPVMRPVPGSPASFPDSYRGDYFYFEYFAGTLHRLREAQGRWDFAPPVPGQPDAETWATDLRHVADAQLGADGALWFVVLGFGPEPGLFRIARAAGEGDPRLLPHGKPAAARRAGSARPNPFRVAGGTELRAADALPGSRIRILDAAGRVVRRLPVTGGTAHWDARARNGIPVAPGLYVARWDTADGARALKLTVLR